MFETKNWLTMCSWVCLWCYYHILTSFMIHANMESTCFIRQKWQNVGNGSQARTNQKRAWFISSCYQQILVNSMLPCLCLVIVHKLHQNEVITKRWHTWRSRVCYRCSSPLVNTLRAFHPSRKPNKKNHWEQKILRKVLEKYSLSSPLVELKRRIDVTPRAPRGAVTSIFFWPRLNQGIGRSLHFDGFCDPLINTEAQ